jgi:hypothetical protein
MDGHLLFSRAKAVAELLATLCLLNIKISSRQSSEGKERPYILQMKT